MYSSLDSAHIRLLWDIVEAHKNLLKELTDDAIGRWVIKTAKEKLCLSSEELVNIRRYVSSHALLIRDVLDSE